MAEKSVENGSVNIDQEDRATIEAAIRTAKMREQLTRVRELREKQNTPDSTTFSQLKEDLVTGGRRLKKGFEGMFEVFLGVVRWHDGIALGLGAVAILTICEPTVAPLWAMVSKDKNIANTGGEIYSWSRNPRLARVFGYPLLALGEGYGLWQLGKALTK